eukprot:CAMPEP_0201635974 /NCGR_PEP_ID=MMETSP0493-20130528/8308_1 /ASSEMBLY_ACC=CAM_ASM_000838 /TAXON_ID=420259 /ORGANISM="Thalassiosira gravida, Strain GMp14c1" /LENGTH=63 /DNA_ID=CAMNT_0048108001 /DNA_START=112 /DNA_END=300 /DNA_ORIENTATION=+
MTFLLLKRTLFISLADMSCSNPTGQGLEELPDDVDGDGDAARNERTSNTRFLRDRLWSSGVYH